MEKIDKIFNELIELRETIGENAIAIKHLSYVLKKEMKKKDNLEEELKEIKKNNEFLESHSRNKYLTQEGLKRRIDELEEDKKILIYEKNLLLRKLNPDPKHPDDLS